MPLECKFRGQCSSFLQNQLVAAAARTARRRPEVGASASSGCIALFDSAALSCAMPKPAVILFAHGAREREWARPFEEVRDRLRAQGLRVELAYLEIMKPSLEETARVLASEDAKTVTVVPLFLGQGKHLKRE